MRTSNTKILGLLPFHSGRPGQNGFGFPQGHAIDGFSKKKTALNKPLVGQLNPFFGQRQLYPDSFIEYLSRFDAGIILEDGAG